MSDTKLGLYNFYWNCGRKGVIDSLFIATQEHVDSLIGKSVHFGEVLGKHSDVYGYVEEDEIVLVTENSGVIETLREAFKGKNICGYNPLEHICEEEEINVD